MQIITKKFDDKSTLLYHENKLSNITNIVLTLNGGAAAEGKHMGLAHYIEHLFFENLPIIDGMPSKEYFYINNIQTNAFTGTNVIAITFSFDSKHIDNIVNVLNTMLTQKQYDKTTLKGVFTDVVNETYETGVVKNHKISEYPYLVAISELKVLAPVEMVKPYKLKDVVEYKNNIIQTQNMVFAISSNLSQETIEKCCNNIKQNVATGNKVFEPISVYVSDPKKNLIQYNYKKDIQTVEFTLKLCSSASSFENRLIKTVMENIMCGFTGRLYRILRTENGLSYINGMRSDVVCEKYSAHTIQFTTNCTKTAKANKIFENLIKDLVENGITEEEYENLRKIFVLKENQPKLVDIDFLSIITETYKDQGNVESSYETLLSMSREQINKLIKNNFKQCYYAYVIAGNFDKTKLLNPVKFAESTGLRPSNVFQQSVTKKGQHIDSLLKYQNSDLYMIDGYSVTDEDTTCVTSYIDNKVYLPLLPKSAEEKLEEEKLIKKYNKKRKLEQKLKKQEESKKTTDTKQPAQPAPKTENKQPAPTAPKTENKQPATEKEQPQKQAEEQAEDGREMVEFEVDGQLYRLPLEEYEKTLREQQGLSPKDHIDYGDEDFDDEDYDDEDYDDEDLLDSIGLALQRKTKEEKLKIIMEDYKVKSANKDDEHTY